MFQYLLRRLLFFVPSLLIIVFLVLWLSNQSVDDPVETLDSSNTAQRSVENWNEERANEVAYLEIAQKYHLNLSLFYFSVQSIAYEDSLNYITFRSHRQNALDLVHQYGNGQAVWQYYKNLKNTHEALFSLPDDSTRNVLLDNIKLLYVEKEEEKVISILDTVQKNVTNTTVLSRLSALSTSYQHIRQNATPFYTWLPTLRWHGTKNRYHVWLNGLVHGDFGTSYRSQRLVFDEIKESIGWTMLINILAVLCIFGIAIPLGVYMAAKQGSRFDRWSANLFFGLHTMPLFWLATVVMIFFTSNNYGLQLFARTGLGDIQNQFTVFGKIIVALPHLIAPVLCLTLYSVASLSQQMRSSILSVLNEDFIRTARMKGLSDNIVLWKHAFRNALFPIITLFASIFPEIITGSLVLENVFNIPGMGKLAAGAVADHDIPIVLALVLLTGVMTLIGYLVSDVLYRVVDPRV
jgi:peptide/nickel transport system permease protein